jgi:hypothetical protein
VRDHGVKGVETAVNLHERFPDGVVALPLDGRRQAGGHIGHNDRYIPTVVNVVHVDSTGNPTAAFDPRREERDSCTSV